MKGTLTTKEIKGKQTINGVVSDIVFYPEKKTFIDIVECATGKIFILDTFYKNNIPHIIHENIVDSYDLEDEDEK